MKQITLTIYTILLIGFSNQILAQAAPDSAAMMKAWTSFMTPGDVHKMLAKDDGDWNEEITMWMAPGAPPTKNTATASNKMILGGRYQEAKHTGTIMGMPFEGHSLLGYDNAKKIFVNTWIDNMGTGITFMEGKWDEKTKTINFAGKSTDPLTGKDIPVRQIFTLVDDNTQKVEMFMTQGGKEFKSMEIKLTRK